MIYKTKKPHSIKNMAFLSRKVTKQGRYTRRYGK